jgi:hypothetical protein
MKALRMDYSKGYQWWTFGRGRELGGWWVKLGPLTLMWYRLRRWHLGACWHGSREMQLWGRFK